MSRMSDADAQQFLADPRIAVMSINQPGRPPLSIPIWYDYSPGGDLGIVTVMESVKARALRAAGTATMVVQEVSPRIRYVSVECELVDELAPDVEFQRSMASRYLPADAVEGFLQSVPPEGRFVLRPTRWRTADLG